MDGNAVVVELADGVPTPWCTASPSGPPVTPGNGRHAGCLHVHIARTITRLEKARMEY